ncbi:zinc finger BED domain-containing protein 5-like [Erpetoichthys calabaricus]|uniref:zinc finger BED domain-containing protein 5-like n=1 Tax=Erpetoichthys calabaricus TaxID=27687 RepID=UPI002234D8E0|nr:zinc finger BED domain-containing protein 5-like [Erpetoichthys calabaricus]
MDRFVKKHKLEDAAAPDDTQVPEQLIEAAAATVSTATTQLQLPKNAAGNPQLKVRQYSDNYLALGFTWMGDPDCPSPLCIVCGEKLANSAMAPAKLKRHLTTRHPEVSDKNAQYFQRTLALNKKQTAAFEKKFKISKKPQEASYAVTEIVAKKMKSHNVTETVILLACQEMVRIMFGEDVVSESNKIPLSDNTISRHIADMSSDTERNVLSKIKSRGFFAIQVDKSTDISSKAQLLAFVRFSDNEAIMEDFFCCKELPETTKGQDVYDVLNSPFQSCELTWENCVGICTNGAPAMTGNVKGFVSLAQQQNPNIIVTHCFLHREALVAKTIGRELKSVLDMVVKIVNYMKMRPLKCRQFAKVCESVEADHVTLIQHIDVRWLSRGKVLRRFYELREEMVVFCSQGNLKDFAEVLGDESWCSKLAYLADIFHELNFLNSGMQGRNENILTSTDKISAFRKKLTIWKKRASPGNVEMFPSVVDRNCQDILPLILNHLDTLLAGLSKYFPSISMDQYDWI